MEVKLKAVTRENWQEALRLKVKDVQNYFVPTVAVSLAKVHVKPDGDNVNYLPFAIYEEAQGMIGFVMHAFVENTNDMYWINGFIIDEKHQGKGYGRSALCEMINWIINQYPKCEEIRLTVHKENDAARQLYKSLGFLEAGEFDEEEDLLRLLISREK
ncbi:MULTISPECIES: GNAT family N-acetyltransferase [unclassified Bacillus (in: firmicutes)]|uniref:GNAT family N-acetyltransferase n=1 Tax=unclassified Bacillus (in: firmicutes) TaxID=185979 RepID=UPI00232FBA45|nr:GNAT family N-acetyltransferase [Bacillus sp. BP-3]MDC2866345.1 GNAT family N-acetyltransferase [Bacillus sp. BP-3]